MVVRMAFFDILRNERQRLVGKTLQPQDTRTEIVRGNPQVEREYPGFFGQQMQVGIDAVDVLARTFLVAEIVQGDGHKPIGQHHVSGIR